MKHSAFCILAFSAPLFGATTAAPEAPPQQLVEVPAEQSHDIAKLSEALGHMIGRHLEDTVGVQLDLARVIEGLKGAREGKEPPMNEMELAIAMEEVHAATIQKLATDNLQQANDFLASNQQRDSVVSLADGKVQYLINHPGQGAPIEENAILEARYKGTFLNGKVFASSTTPETLALEEVIPGLAQGMLGMRPGETRTIYIHPDLAYGMGAGSLPPNTLLTFEIEMVSPVLTATRESTPPEATIVGETPPAPTSAQLDLR